MANKEENVSKEVRYLGMLILIPFILVSIIRYLFLRRQYLNENVQRVVDIFRLAKPFVFSGTCVVVWIFIIAGFSNDAGVHSSGTKLLILFLKAGLVAYCLAASCRFAVLYLGIIVDEERDLLVFPPDMQSYTIPDYLSMRFALDWCNADTIPLSAIERMTRGRGTELYIHGRFGSRRITMSSKQKRDECLSMILEIIGGGMMHTELESY